MQAYADMLQSNPGADASPAFDHLAPDADEQTRQSVAEELAEETRGLYEKHPGLLELDADAPGGSRHAWITAGKALIDLYNPAQIDVLQRVHELLHGS